MEIKVNPLNRSSIRKAYADLVSYKESLEQFPKLFVTALSERFNEILNSQAPAEATGMWSFYIIRGEDSAEGVFVFDGKVEFIEFGTGVIGLNNHDGINTEWLDRLPPPYNQGYNTGPSIVHFEDQNEDYWVYYDEGIRHWTQGVPADPFIYRSVKQLLEEKAKIARKVFKENRIGNDVVFIN